MRYYPKHVFAARVTGADWTAFGTSMPFIDGGIILSTGSAQRHGVVNLVPKLLCFNFPASHGHRCLAFNSHSPSSSSIEKIRWGYEPSYYCFVRLRYGKLRLHNRGCNRQQLKQQTLFSSFTFQFTNSTISGWSNPNTPF